MIFLDGMNKAAIIEKAIVCPSCHGSLAVDEADLRTNLARWMVRARIEEAELDGKSRRFAKRNTVADLHSMMQGAVEKILSPLVESLPDQEPVTVESMHVERARKTVSNRERDLKEAEAKGAAEAEINELQAKLE